MIYKQFIRLAIFGYMMSAFFVLADASIDSIAIYENDYQPGVGRFIGKVAAVSGDGVIIHLNEKAGYQVIGDMKVYRGDTILTGYSATVLIHLNDGSQISQGSKSKIQFTQVIYSPKNRTRNSFIHMSSGRARFSVKKLKSYKNRRFRVKTTSALIGVRGSDFVIQVRPDQTEVAAFDNTTLALIGLDMPDLPPVILNAFEKSSIISGESPTSPISLSIEEMDGLKKEFLLDRKALPQTDDTQDKEAASEKIQTIRITQSDAKESSVQQLIVDADALKPPLANFSDVINNFVEKKQDDITYVSEQKHEIATELPEFPEFP
jgi:hypothetical protein